MSETTAEVAAEVAKVESDLAALKGEAAAPTAASPAIIHGVAITAGVGVHTLSYTLDGVSATAVLDIGNPVLTGFHAALSEWWKNIEGAAFDYQQKLKLGARG